MDERERRLADNQVLFRAVNEQIERLAGDDDDRYGFVCECGDRGCTDKINLTLDEYEAVRAHGARFAVARGHALPEIERVVERHEGYDVVEKDAAAARHAEAHDPRA